jgi:BMFP domain-containing protein YqiC
VKLIEKERLKELREKRVEKRLEKPQIDKSSARDKGLTEKIADGKFSDGKFAEGGGLGGGLGGGAGSQSELAVAHLEARVSALESALSGQSGVPAPQPFIGSQLRPDLSQGAFSAEEDFSELHEQMRQGSAEAKRQYDTKLKEQS